MDIERYAQIAPQYYGIEVSPLLVHYLRHECPSTILDCGCGDGALLAALKERGLLREKRVLAVDLSQTRIGRARLIDDSFRLSVDSVEHLSTIEADSIDFLMATQVIEHVDDARMVDSIHRVVKSGGVAYLTTVFKKAWAWYFYRNDRGTWVLDPTHLREYEKDSDLLRLFDSHRFEIADSKKATLWLSLGGFILPRLGLTGQNLGRRSIPRLLKSLKLPIPGYFTWEIVVRKI